MAFIGPLTADTTRHTCHLRAATPYSLGALVNPESRGVVVAFFSFAKEIILTQTNGTVPEGTGTRHFLADTGILYAVCSAVLHSSARARRVCPCTLFFASAAQHDHIEPVDTDQPATAAQLCPAPA